MFMHTYDIVKDNITLRLEIYVRHIRNVNKYCLKFMLNNEMKCDSKTLLSIKVLKVIAIVHFPFLERTKLSISAFI